MKFIGWLAWKHFMSTEMSRFRPGNSHRRIDRAFSVIGTALNKQVALQTADDFQRAT